MIYIKEHFPDDSSVRVDVQGILDPQSIPILSRVFENHMRRGRTIVLNFRDVRHINREVMDFLHQMDNKKLTINYPQFMESKESESP